MAQIFASVSKAMHEEFDIAYMKKVMEPFGLFNYGCCEPLDKKIDIVEQLPHLRKISITPWADIDNAAEVIGKRYVIANKPIPQQSAAVWTRMPCGRKSEGPWLPADGMAAALTWSLRISAPWDIRSKISSAGNRSSWKWSDSIDPGRAGKRRLILSGGALRSAGTEYIFYSLKDETGNIFSADCHWMALEVKM